MSTFGVPPPLELECVSCYLGPVSHVTTSVDQLNSGQCRNDIIINNSNISEGKIMPDPFTISTRRDGADGSSRFCRQSQLVSVLVVSIIF